MRIGVAAALVDGRVVPGDVDVDAGVVSAVGKRPAGGRGLAVPGFVDLQVNGFAGHDFSSTDVEGYLAAGHALAATGVTAYQPTFISLPVAMYAPSLAVAGEARAQRDGVRILGVHLEGPFLSTIRSGAHDPGNTLDPDPALAAELCAAGPVTYMTVAPEREKGVALIRHLASRGVVMACGHSDADAATAHAAFDAGARAVTHLFNASRPWRHRDPGIAGAALVRDDVTLTIILDGAHLAPETVSLVRRTAPGRIALITDAIAAAGRGDGEFVLGDRRVTVRGGVARLSDGTLAGSVLTMDAAIRNFVALGASIEEAVGAATVVPANLLGRSDVGVLSPGAVADVVVLDDALEVDQTFVAGEQMFRR